MNDIDSLKEEVAAIKSLLQKILFPEEKTLNLTVEELSVRIQNKREPAVDLDTSTIEGKIMFCALKDLALGTVFSQAQLIAALDERGWRTAQSSVSKALGRIVSKGLLISMERQGYRLPAKVTFVGEEP
jgi:hypothetical protein